MSNLTKVWRPHGTQEAWSVSWNGPPVMSKSQYERLLQYRLEELIEANPKTAYNLLTDSPESSPNLYEIAIHGNKEHWAIQIVLCDQMQMFLNQIDWSKAGQSQSLAKKDLPSLFDICATIP
jgi:hypothetical protein